GGSAQLHPAFGDILVVFRMYVRATNIRSPKGRVPGIPVRATNIPSPKGRVPRGARLRYKHSVSKGTGTPATNIWSNGAWIGALIQVCLHVRTRWYIHKGGAHDNRGP